MVRAAIIRRAFTAFVAVACIGSALSQFATCDDEYECVYEAATSDGFTFKFDLRPLCELGTTYNVADTSGHNYSFNICGTSSFECVPSWTNVYETGVAVQYWGDPPACNATTANCTDYRGNNVCCTQNCQVLGVGIPNWQLKVPADPEYGGLLVTHVGVPPSDDDPFWCPWNPNTGSMYERTITYDFTCNTSMPLGEVAILGASENKSMPCSYTIYLASFHGCGCSPNCANRNCGPDGCGGWCGGGDGTCPGEYECIPAGTCCYRDCRGRECGADGCGGTCGYNNGGCDAGEVCYKNQCVPDQTPTPSPSVASPTSSLSFTRSPAPPPYTIEYMNAPGTVAGSFFGGLFTALFVGWIGSYCYRKRTGYYTKYSVQSGGATGGSYSGMGAPVTTSAYSSQGGYGSSTATQKTDLGYGSL